MFEKLLRNWFNIKNKTELNLIPIFGSPIECSDERGIYYIEEIFFDNDKDLCAWCTDIDGGEFELSGVFLSKEDEIKIINWLTNNA